MEATAAKRRTPVIPREELEKQQHICHEIAAFWHEQGQTPTAWVVTYGCQQNEADSEQLRGMLLECGYTMAGQAEGADLVIMNTCAVREHAEQRVYGNLGALVHTKRRHPAQKIFVCGCMMGQPQVAERIKKSYAHVDGVFSTHHLWRFPELLQRVLLTGRRTFFTQDSAGAIAEGLPVVRQNGIKAWISIMYGCNNFCTYCIVPYVRGRERSRLPEDILNEARQLIAAGYKDITLLGQNVNSYGKDLGTDLNFAGLLAQVAELDGDFIVRFMTSHPKDATHALFDTMASHPKIARHIHLPFQAGNDRVLQAMNRRYTAAQYLELVDYARSVMPDIVLTSDVIVGFPGETEAEFEDTLRLIERVRYDALFTFIFSPREGTPAAKMPDPFTRQEKQVWFDRLVDTQNRISEERHAAYVGTTCRCLIDGQDGDMLTARTAGGRLVRLQGSPDLIGSFRNLTITGSSRWSLTGTPAD